MTTDQLLYSSDELLSEHAYDSVPSVDGHVLHGGFVDGVYTSPRTAIRSPAMAAWTRALQARGGSPLPADSSLLTGPRVPTASQQMVLVRNGLDQSFWNSLTIIGKIEARGRFLAEMEIPDLQLHIVEDISQMAIGHLGKGLLVAHGLDEGGVPSREIGGHDQMWFAARDLAFGLGAHPDVEPPETIARPVTHDKVPPSVSPEAMGLISFLANLLIIEFRAEIGFADTQAVLRNPDLFVERRPEAELAAEIVEHIRADELIHVDSLRLYMGELRSVTFRTNDGSTLPGGELIDSFWDDLLDWATVVQPELAAAQQHAVLTERISVHPEADRVRAEFEAAA